MPSFANVHLPQWLAGPLQNSVNRLEFTLNPSISLKRLKHYTFTWRHDAQYLFLACLALANLATAQSPPLLGKIFIVAAYTTGLLIPLTSQFVLPATPIFSWLLNYWASRWTVALLKPHIWVSVLPTLESVLYGANISDILTRYTSSTLDILAWIPYGVLHFSLPFVCAALIWIFGPPGAVKFFAKVFGYMNLLGVMCQIFFPCTPPWYELRQGLTPADYGMKGSPGGLARIDALFGGNGYTNTFTNSPMAFGAFPSLHAGCATTDALLMYHFFPQFKVGYLVYVMWLYWSTMYLTHHYLIDLVAGASLAVGTFYFFLNQDPAMRDWAIFANSVNSKMSRASVGGTGESLTNLGVGVDSVGNGIHGDMESGYKFPVTSSLPTGSTPAAVAAAAATNAAALGGTGGDGAGSSGPNHVEGYEMSAFSAPTNGRGSHSRTPSSSKNLASISTATSSSSTPTPYGSSHSARDSLSAISPSASAGNATAGRSGGGSISIASSRAVSPRLHGSLSLTPAGLASPDAKEGESVARPRTPRAADHR